MLLSIKIFPLSHCVSPHPSPACFKTLSSPPPPSFSLPIHSPGCYHHFRDILTLKRLSTSRKRNMMGLVDMNCDTMVYCLPMYTSTFSIPTFRTTSAIRGYSHPPSGRNFERFLLSRLSIQWYNLPRVHAIPFYYPCLRPN